MTFRNATETRYPAAPESATESEAGTTVSDWPGSRRRNANLFDAVAGLVSTSEALATRSRRSTRAKYRLRDPTLAPEEVLFSRRGGPQRYMENGFYFAHEALPDGGRDVLPDSDLLKAVHAYASRFYERLGQRHDTGSRNDCFVGARHVDEQSMDETALLAFGILLEEAGREVLGRRGDLVFTEGLSDEPARPDDRNETEGDAGEASRASPDGTAGLEGGDALWDRDSPKRRKLTARDDDREGN